MLNKSEQYCLEHARDEIRKLVSMEACGFKDEKTVDMFRLRSWLTWFQVNADLIDDVLQGKAADIVKYEQYRLR